MKIIELSRLTGACKGQMAIVRAEWPNGIPVTQESLDRALGLDLDLRWAAEILLSSSAWAEYRRVRDQARVEYDRVFVQIWGEECPRVYRQALAEYDRACGQALLSALLADGE